MGNASVELNNQNNPQNSNSSIMKKFITLIIFFFISKTAISDPIDEIKADMSQNEATLLLAPDSVGWSKKAFIGMGNMPRGDNTPSWWKPNDISYKSSSYWSAITPWFVIYPGEDHKATNVRIKVSELKLYILERSTEQWKLINLTTTPSWQMHLRYVSPSTASQAVDVKTETDGSISYKLNVNLNPIHGGVNKYTINEKDIGAVFVKMKTKLILDNPSDTDDRAESQILVSVGADYYPTIKHVISDFSPMKYIPAVGFSRYGLVHNAERIHYFATIAPPGPDNIGAKYSKRNQNTTIPIKTFLSNLPPDVK
ncbi:hypothetical protein [Nitrosomonas sp.]|uniref:hypothetical protein n=1 Tax=Nitrosomonas sp. TaxID=42353 RepID=UPI002080AB1E|nr:hypothetical protein [Nitrosomonas sp.]GJL74303.1 MAG: hypothetical protein NMNS02_04090 [Nitrosomonas sp.]